MTKCLDQFLRTLINLVQDKNNNDKSLSTTMTLSFKYKTLEFGERLRLSQLLLS